jgi:predicted NUDIX family phosphoesterase
MDENILVIPAADANKLPVVNGFTRDVSTLPELLNKSTSLFRSTVETDENYKQVIPYALLKYGETYFYYMRSKKVSEERLRLNFSLGVGGHVNAYDFVPDLRNYLDILVNARDREILEEFDCRLKPGANIAGLINDNSTAVGRVHLGVVYECELLNDAVTPRETANFERYGFASIDELRRREDSFENWSRILVSEYLS